MKRKIIIGFSVVCLTLMCINSVAYAAYSNWTSKETLYITNSAKKSSKTSTKYTNNTKVGVGVKDMTMISNPKARAVNSKGAQRSDWVTLAHPNRNYYASNSSAVIGHKYWLEVKPAFNQIGKDAITFNFSMR